MASYRFACASMLGEIGCVSVAALGSALTVNVGSYSQCATQARRGYEIATPDEYQMNPTLDSLQSLDRL